MVYTMDEMIEEGKCQMGEMADYYLDQAMDEMFMDHPDQYYGTGLAGSIGPGPVGFWRTKEGLKCIETMTDLHLRNTLNFLKRNEVYPMKQAEVQEEIQRRKRNDQYTGSNRSGSSVSDTVDTTLQKLKASTMAR